MWRNQCAPVTCDGGSAGSLTRTTRILYRTDSVHRTHGTGDIARFVWRGTTPEGGAMSLSPKPAARTVEAVDELLAEMAGLRARMAEHPDLADELSQLEVNRWIFSITQVALDCFVWADVDAPRFVDIVGTTKKWGGDNADAFYQHAPIGPGRRYRVSGWRGDAAYMSLTVYAGPDDGHYSERIVGTVNDEQLAFDEEGRFSFWVAPEPLDDGPGIITDAESVVALTRDYLADPVAGRRCTWRIECIDDAPPYEFTDDDLARRVRAALTWVRDQAAIVPVGDMDSVNAVADPYPVPTATYGWAAGDAAYAMGSFELAEGEQLVIRGRSPKCRFWNLVLWNPLLHTYNYDRDRVTINGAQVRYEPDGSFEIVVAASDPGHPNWVSTQGHRRGRIWLRWFLPEHTPEPLTTSVEPIGAGPVGAGSIGGGR